MRSSGFARGRRFPAALGIFLFAIVSLFVFLYTLPKETVLSPLNSALAVRGLEFGCEETGFVFPLGLRCGNAVISRRGAPPLSIDTVVAAWEWTGLFQWLPFHLRAVRGPASVDIRTSPMISNPGKVRLRLLRIGPEDLGPLFPASAGTGFLIDSAELEWKVAGNGSISGAGEGFLSLLRLPIPGKDSPVTEAELRDVRLKFTIREGMLLVSSLTGTYEGADVEGTGEISGFLTPSRSTVTFHLRIRNPLEGRVATLFNLVAKNAKNATLRINGTLQAPAGEFQFF
ncbi:MAG: type II secretion system protein GspN [Deltaproteobacteria bacterium]|nr:type II secretion system protein GspN [Deltaproteobacteria bacterium]